MADFRVILGAAGVHYIDSTFVISRQVASDIALWGGGPRGEDLTLAVLDPDVINFFDISNVSAPMGDHLRRIRLEVKDFGQTTLQARLGPNGPSWADAAIAVEGTVMVQGVMHRAHDAPVDGSIPAALGLASVIRIPVPGTNGLAIELSPRGWTPKGGSTSRLFIQDIAGKRVLRLDYGFNVKTQAVDFHWNQKGTFNEFGIADHAPAGAGGEALFRGAKYFRYGGRVLLVAAVAIDVYSIVVSSNPLRRSTQVVAGWVGAWAGCKAVGAGGAYVGTLAEPGLGTAIGGLVGCAVGGFIGYETASAGAGRAYDWAENTIFTPVPASDTP
jgi:hypothetical protein